MFHVFYLFFIVGYISALQLSLFHGDLYNNFFVDFDLLEVGTTMRHHIYIFYLCLGQAVLFFNLSESNLDWWGQVEQCLIQSPVQRCTGLLWQAFFFRQSSCRRRDRMVVGFTTTYSISAYRHCRCEFESHSGKVYSI